MRDPAPARVSPRGRPGACAQKVACVLLLLLLLLTHTHTHICTQGPAKTYVKTALRPLHVVPTAPTYIYIATVFYIYYAVCYVIFIIIIFLREFFSYFDYIYIYIFFLSFHSPFSHYHYFARYFHHAMYFGGCAFNFNSLIQPRDVFLHYILIIMCYCVVILYAFI